MASGCVCDWLINIRKEENEKWKKCCKLHMIVVIYELICTIMNVMCIRMANLKVKNDCVNMHMMNNNKCWFTMIVDKQKLVYCFENIQWKGQHNWCVVRILKMFDIYKCVSFANTANSLMNVDARIVMTIEIGHENVLRNGLQYIENLSKNIWIPIV